jgi:hypothetical protein
LIFFLSLSFGLLVFRFIGGYADSSEFLLYLYLRRHVLTATKSLAVGGALSAICQRKGAPLSELFLLAVSVRKKLSFGCGGVLCGFGYGCYAELQIALARVSRYLATPAGAKHYRK